jgi:hypothetical protein
VPIGKGAAPVSFPAPRFLAGIEMRPFPSGFDSVVLGASEGAASKYSPIKINLAEKAGFLHRHHLKVHSR